MAHIAVLQGGWHSPARHQLALRSIVPILALAELRCLADAPVLALEGAMGHTALFQDSVRPFSSVALQFSVSATAGFQFVTLEAVDGGVVAPGDWD